jgi:hypothetical protein
VVDAEACNIDSFLSRDISVFSTQLNRAIWNKESLSPHGKLKFPKIFLSKTTSIFTGK